MTSEVHLDDSGEWRADRDLWYKVMDKFEEHPPFYGYGNNASDTMRDAIDHWDKALFDPGPDRVYFEVVDEGMVPLKIRLAQIRHDNQFARMEAEWLTKEGNG